MDAFDACALPPTKSDREMHLDSEDAEIYVVVHRGMVSGAIWSHLEDAGYNHRAE